MAQHEEPGHGGALAVLACPTAVDRKDLERQLVAGGLSVIGTPDTSEVLAHIIGSRADVLIIDVELALGHVGSVVHTLTEHPDLTGLPVLLILPEGGAGPLPPTLAPYVSDVLFRPIGQVELLHRTRAAIARRRGQQAKRDASARLRTAMRRISADIRATNAPEVMMERFLTGAGTALGAHHTALQIFADDRVAPRSTSWSAADATTSLSPPRDDHRPGDLELALKLWEGSAVASFSGPAGSHAGATETGAVVTAGDPGRVRRPDAATVADPGPDMIASPGWMLEALGRDTALEGVALALGEGDTPFGLLWVVREGPLAWSGVEAALTQHVLGNLAHGLIQAQLISRQQQAVRKLSALNQARSDFVGSVNHELRTPLASITGYLEMILDDVGGELPAEARTMLQAVERNTAKLHQLIENISSVSAQQVEDTDHAPVDLAHLLADLMRTLAPEAAEARVHLNCSLPSGVAGAAVAAIVSGDRGQLAAALGVVLSNALEFTRPTGAVTARLTVDDTAGGVRLEITDTGVGIPAAELRRLLDASPRAVRTLPEPHDGRGGDVAGTGLSLVRRTVEAHRGTMDITSELGTGTTVAFTLPLLDRAVVGGPDSPRTDVP